MPKDRGQLTPADPDRTGRLSTHRGRGTAGTGQGLLAEEAGSGGVTGEAQEATATEGGPAE